jgi:hypothetical protein
VGGIEQAAEGRVTMNVKTLIEELQRLPQYLSVRASISSVWMPINGNDVKRVDLDRADAMDAHTVRHEGNHVLIEGDV